MPSIDGLWTKEEEEEILKHYGFEPVPGLEDSYRFKEEAPPGDAGARVFGREEALEMIRPIRRAAYGLSQALVDQRKEPPKTTEGEA